VIDLTPDASVALIIALALLVLFAGVIIGSRRQAAPTPQATPTSTNDRLAAVENRMLEVEQKLNKISVEVQHLPTAETVAAMAVKIADIGGDVKALHTSVLATNRLVERIDQWLLTKGTP
jgi:hypothetical protein